MEVCAANGSQSAPKTRRRFVSIDTVPAGGKEDQRRNITVANQMHQRPDADPRQERVTRDADDPLWRLPDAFLLGDRGRVWLRQTDDDQQRAGSIRMIAIGFHHSSIPQVTR